MTRIAYMTLDEQPVPRDFTDPECNAKTEIAASNSSDETRTINAVYRDRRGPSNKKRSTYYANNTKKEGYGTNTRGPSSRLGCFVCCSSRHFMAHCPEKHCPKCGKKGHELRACPDSGSRKIFTTSATVRTTRETSVVTPVSLDGKQTDTMLDTGADPSVEDRVTLQGLGINYQRVNSRVFGLGHIPIKLCGKALLTIDTGDSQIADHEVDVLDAEVKTVILGRRFLGMFGETSFDWLHLRVRLGNVWKESKAGAKGGHWAGQLRYSSVRTRRISNPMNSTLTQASPPKNVYRSTRGSSP